MKNIFSTLVLLVLMLFTQRSAHAIHSIASQPTETAVLLLPKNRSQDWNEICRIVSNLEGLVERIPFHQTSKNWSQLIAIQYVSREQGNREAMTNIETLVNTLRKSMASSYPRGMFTWKILEKNKNDILYEWIVQKHGNVSFEHEISRGFLTESGFHRVGFTRKNSEMSPAEREKWINLLKESASVVSYQEAANISEGISLLDRESTSKSGIRSS